MPVTVAWARRVRGTLSDGRVLHRDDSRYRPITLSDRRVTDRTLCARMRPHSVREPTPLLRTRHHARRPRQPVPIARCGSMHRIPYAPQHEPTKRRKHRRATVQVLQL